MSNRSFVVGVVAASMLVASFPSWADAHESERQYYELRTYRLESEAGKREVDEYLEQALLPALERMGLGPVGVFTERDPEDGPGNLYVLIPFDSLEQVGKMKAGLDEDETYQSDAEEYFERGTDEPAYERIESEMLVAFESFPHVEVPEEKETGKDRLFELRIYESATERLGDLKVEMFDEGETDIFLEVGIQPVFMGQAIAGNKMPNLTYLAVYPDQATRDEVWEDFLEHPDWEELSGMERYEGTVSNIHQVMLEPRDYSGL